MGELNAPPLVLVADDEPSMLELVASHLRTWDSPRLDVVEASDGEEAWRLAREHLPDLVVLDVMMPGMSGWEVCRKIREDVAFAHTAVAMLTGIGENLNQMTSPLYGADVHIDKPFDFAYFDEKIREALRARASQREAVARPMRNGVGGPARAAISPDTLSGEGGALGASKTTTPRRKKKKGRGSMAAKKGAAKKSAAKKGAARKAVAKKAAVKKSAAKKGAARKSVAKKAVAKKAAAKKAPARKAAAKKGARTGAAKKAAAKKGAAKKGAAKKGARKSARRATPTLED